MEFNEVLLHYPNSHFSTTGGGPDPDFRYIHITHTHTHARMYTLYLYLFACTYTHTHYLKLACTTLSCLRSRFIWPPSPLVKIWPTTLFVRPKKCIPTHYERVSRIFDLRYSHSTTSISRRTVVFLTRLPRSLHYVRAPRR